MAKPTASTPLLSGGPVSTSLPSVTDYGGTMRGGEPTIQDSEQLEDYNETSNVPIGLILFTAFCERMAFYSVLSNMVLFCVSKFNFTDFNASITVWIFSGTSYMITPLIGGFIADSVCGRYNTILGSGFIFFIGDYDFSYINE
ncbi:hypothetical protein CHS0354_019496 [Potamilus streckersoni]|uniref:Uncharacterized protein n=1 Tax=Potamilus streckersoni TaxID=2493646 RepID=A0AAE0SGQ1_9BIVA|nr:hypothetical protein CHS0354_019496 [Potamilus streckersoni]